MKKTDIAKMMRAIFEMEKTEGLRCTLLGIGPMSLPVIEASFLAAKEKDFPVMFIASRNQIDCNELGGGYVCGWDQREFVKAIAETAKKVGFEGIYHICRDHGGPWQRDNERNAKLPENEAMEKGKQSYLEDLLAGFDLLHIDPTKDPHISGVIPFETVIGRTVELIEYVEGERNKRHLPPIAYEVGTEETNGGLTGEQAYKEFIERLTGILNAKNLPLPSFIVGQTGTLTRLTENVGHFNALTAKNLSSVARGYTVGLKEHNGDYLADMVLFTHPMLGISATNVAPEYGVVETQINLFLAELEKYAFLEGLIKEPSRFEETIKREAFKCGRWKKWMVESTDGLTEEQAFADEKLIDLIVQISGHYTFEIASVKAEKEKMYRNLEQTGMDPEAVVVNAVKKSIERYAEAFNLFGLTSRLKKHFKRNKNA